MELFGVEIAKPEGLWLRKGKGGRCEKRVKNRVEMKMAKEKNGDVQYNLKS